MKFPIRMFSVGVVFAYVLAGCAQSPVDSESSAPSTPASSAPAASDTQTASITFPASDKEKTKYNAAIFDIPPFTFSFDCPADWEFKELASNPPTDAMMKEFGCADSPLLLFSDDVWSTEEVWSGDQCIGLMGYNTFDPDAVEPYEIFSQLAYGNDYNFNLNTMYLPVHTTDTTESAITYVYYIPSILGTDNPRYHWGLTFYDTARHVYVAIEFAKDAASISQLVALCQSMSIADAQPASTATD